MDTDRHLLDGIAIPAPARQFRIDETGRLIEIEPPREIDSMQVSPYLQLPLRSLAEAEADRAKLRERREQSRRNRLG